MSATNSKNKNIRNLYRGINEFQKRYQPRNKLVKDENAVLFADSHNILSRWKNCFSQLLTVHNIGDVRANRHIQQNNQYLVPVIPRQNCYCKVERV
jgi:hypothetical protein